MLTPHGPGQDSLNGSRNDADTSNSLPESGYGRTELRFHSTVSGPTRNQVFGLASGQFGNERFVLIQDPLDIGEEYQLVRREAARASNGHLVGVDVVDVVVPAAGDTSDRGKVTLSSQQIENRGIDLIDFTDRPQVFSQRNGADQTGVNSGKAHGACTGVIQLGDQMVIDLAREYPQNGIQHFRRGDPESVAKFAFDSVSAEVAAESLASAMDHHGFVAGLNYSGDLLREAPPGCPFLEQGAAKFDQEFHGNTGREAR